MGRRQGSTGKRLSRGTRNLGVMTVLTADCGNGFMGIYLCQNLSRCTLYICVVYYNYTSKLIKNFIFIFCISSLKRIFLKIMFYQFLYGWVLKKIIWNYMKSFIHWGSLCLCVVFIKDSFASFHLKKFTDFISVTCYSLYCSNLLYLY